VERHPWSVLIGVRSQCHTMGETVGHKCSRGVVQAERGLQVAAERGLGAAWTEEIRTSGR
jgi:hypothetical protein